MIELILTIDMNMNMYLYIYIFTYLCMNHVNIIHIVNDMEFWNLDHRLVSMHYNSSVTILVILIFGDVYVGT